VYNVYRPMGKKNLVYYKKEVLNRSRCAHLLVSYNGADILSYWQFCEFGEQAVQTIGNE